MTQGRRAKQHKTRGHMLNIYNQKFWCVGGTPRTNTTHYRSKKVQIYDCFAHMFVVPHILKILKDCKNLLRPDTRPDWGYSWGLLYPVVTPLSLITNSYIDHFSHLFPLKNLYLILNQTSWVVKVDVFEMILRRACWWESLCHHKRLLTES